MIKKVFICGEDPLLLKTREEVLRTAASTVASLETCLCLRARWTQIRQTC